MICRHCGKEIEEGLTFCIYCGEPQDEEAKRPVPEQKPKKSLLAPLLTVLAVAAATAVCLWLFVFRGAEAPELPRVTVDETAFETMGREFAQAILLCDLDTIGADVHPQMREPLVERFGSAEFVFERCTVNDSEVRKLRRSEERAQEQGLLEEFGAEVFIEDAYEVTVDFVAVYHDRPYAGKMSVVVAQIDGSRCVISSQLSEMELAFYEDNYDPGDHYFDTHAEE